MTDLRSIVQHWYDTAYTPSSDDLERALSLAPAPTYTSASQIHDARLVITARGATRIHDAIEVSE